MRAVARAPAVIRWPATGPDEFSSRPPLQLTSGKHASKFSPTGFARAGVSHDAQAACPGRRLRQCDACA
jgi:hypothetical protein